MTVYEEYAEELARPAKALNDAIDVEVRPRPSAACWFHPNVH